MLFFYVQKKCLHTQSVHDKNSNNISITKFNFLANLKLLSLRKLVRYVDMVQKSYMFHRISIKTKEASYKSFLKEGINDTLVFDLNFADVDLNTINFIKNNEGLYVLSNILVENVPVKPSNNFFFNFFNSIGSHLTLNLSSYFYARNS